MKKFEYTVVRVADGQNSAVANIVELNSFGIEGWEVVYGWPIKPALGESNADCAYLMKREIE